MSLASKLKQKLDTLLQEADSATSWSSLSLSEDGVVTMDEYEATARSTSPEAGTTITYRPSVLTELTNAGFIPCGNGYGHMNAVVASILPVLRRQQQQLRHAEQADRFRIEQEGEVLLRALCSDAEHAKTAVVSSTAALDRARDILLHGPKYRGLITRGFLREEAEMNFMYTTITDFVRRESEQRQRIAIAAAGEAVALHRHGADLHLISVAGSDDPRWVFNMKERAAREQLVNEETSALSALLHFQRHHYDWIRSREVLLTAHHALEQRAVIAVESKSRGFVEGGIVGEEAVARQRIADERRNTVLCAFARSQWRVQNKEMHTRFNLEHEEGASLDDILHAMRQTRSVIQRREKRAAHLAAVASSWNTVDDHIGEVLNQPRTCAKRGAAAAATAATHAGSAGYSLRNIFIDASSQQNDPHSVAAVSETTEDGVASKKAAT